MEKRTALLAGATGLVGGQLLPQLIENDIYEKVILLSRRPTNVKHTKIEEVIVDFDKLAALKITVPVDDIFCALGTTIKKAGSQEAFRKVDLRYVKDLSDWGIKNGAKRFMLVSSLGADSHSAIFYNRVKGEAEEAVKASGVATVHIFRPSLLMGARYEFRLGEHISQLLMKGLQYIMVGPLLRYRGIPATKVAKAMVEAAQTEQTGVFVHFSEEMQGK